MPEYVKKLRYQFRFSNGKQQEFTVRLRHPSLDLIAEHRQELPSWARLTFHQCPNCPLDALRHSYCPIAVNLAEVIETFKDSFSIEEADVTISSEAREYHKHVPLQTGVSSLIGLYMVTSGCPIMDKLRPMASTHLPFATVEETMVRAISIYLLAQYFLQKRGKKPDWELKNLVKIYDDITRVNGAFSKRLKSISPKDASLNALFGLDCFANITAFSIQEDELNEIEALFQAYLNEPDHVGK